MLHNSSQSNAGWSSSYIKSKQGKTQPAAAPAAAPVLQQIQQLLLELNNFFRNDYNMNPMIKQQFEVPAGYRKWTYALLGVGALVLVLGIHLPGV